MKKNKDFRQKHCSHVHKIGHCKDMLSPISVIAWSLLLEQKLWQIRKSTQSENNQTIANNQNWHSIKEGTHCCLAFEVKKQEGRQKLNWFYILKRNDKETRVKLILFSHFSVSVVKIGRDDHVERVLIKWLNVKNVTEKKTKNEKVGRQPSTKTFFMIFKTSFAATPY